MRKLIRIFNINMIFTLLCMMCSPLSYAQDGNWDVYMAEWEDGPGSVVLNLDRIKTAPDKRMPFIVITGITFDKCRADGLPEQEMFDKLYEVSDAIIALLASITKSEIVGTFTYQCQRLDYIYVKDTSGIRERLEGLYKDKYARYSYYLNIRPDLNWEAYRDFLYPNEAIMEYLADQKVVQQLINAGDDLIQARKVDHWLYFGNAKDRDKFLSHIRNEHFKVESKDRLKGNKYSYVLRISRKDHVDLDAITSITNMLRQAAKLYGGKYDGWETYVVK